MRGMRRNIHVCWCILILLGPDRKFGVPVSCFASYNVQFGPISLCSYKNIIILINTFALRVFWTRSRTIEETSTLVRF